MTLLWLALAVLLLPALWLLALPLRRASAFATAQRDYEESDRSAEQNLAIYRRRRASLEAARERGEIDDARFDEDLLELERSLLEDTATQARRPLKPAGAGRLMVPITMLAVTVAAFAWYSQQGATGDLALYAVQQEVRQAPNGSPAMMINRLEEEANRQPDNPNVWASLFPLYRDGGRLPRAEAALERLITLEGRQPSLLAQLAQIRFFDANRTLTPEVQDLVDETLDKDPREPTILGMLGIEAFDHGRYEAAIDYWRRAVAGLNTPDAAESLRQGIAVAKARLGQAVSDQDAPDQDAPDQPAAEGPGISVRVRLDPRLAERVDAGASVFVVARDIDGEKPPLAIVRTTVGELPLTVRLDDGAAMSPMAKLSQVQQARLVVRVSPSGQAVPQPGDLVGEHPAVPVTASGDEEAGAPVEVAIDRIVTTSSEADD
ncbi:MULTISPECIES: c-type cytochrome biogenesis protein CcmI [Halomonadaceae]|uniref:c-type cytochrome biogenesis protein CcmI n=1 Tax=Halomonadaceae TaxID=28256 RepID=UPI0015840639|nr:MULTISPECIES: c-type cytochrome biogenesis protein CcmI [Halomonas]MDI4637205.1 c-type cytochrome biogenesis protein CcmI [Halomonas sp. BMC7]NUJ58373.1 c-type cytochrome biogenesis protein CcmI [Halomonas taeanensis]